MHPQIRRPLIRLSLVLLILVDLLGLAAFVLNQWFAVPVGLAWGIASLLALPLTMLVMPAVDTILSDRPSSSDIPFAGNKIPGMGQ